MPNSLEERLVSCHNKLLRLYEENEPEPILLQHLNDVDTYYNTSFNKSIYARKTIVESYEWFVDNLIKVKNGGLSADKALKMIQDQTFNRKLGIAFYNIVKTLETTFWAAASSIFFLCATTITAPNALLGFGLTIIAAALLIKSISNFLQCIDDFKSYTRLNDEDERERYLVTFFKPQNSAASGSRMEIFDEQITESITLAVQ
ncbi:Uncharacterised protein [Legionella steigerwaltii]|uniref:DUF5638 domain-containing protein n=1 Tax=Legionella steigerwaltii TaxID=460 RepID=A0A378LA11_9GAMM|nr:DUF5638 domain-containing protein [Legionella steigerwaltii]KTD81141.1 hypothetical protein Lstg_0368 [Legionella steigerwaltii]STY23170.1 Uncharacterised protein [Legionella steigerwaltii]